MNVSRVTLDERLGPLGASFRFPALAADDGRPDGRGGPVAALSLRSAGSMRFFHDAPNPRRESWFRSVGVDPARVAAVELVHSKDVLWPDSPAELAGRAADGIVVTDPDLVPAVTVADCMPIWISHRPSGAFGVLHSGWKGTGILAEAVAQFRSRLGAEPGGLAVILGPAIGACCYRVPEDRARAFAAEFGEDSGYLDADGHWRLDLAAANLALAERLGIGAALVVDACTACDPRLGSNRREGAENAAAGCEPSFTRMAACVGRIPAFEGT